MTASFRAAEQASLDAKPHVVEIRLTGRGPWILRGWFDDRPTAVGAVGPLVREVGCDRVRVRRVDDSLGVQA